MYAKNVKNKEIVNQELEGFMIYLLHTSFFRDKGLKYKFIIVIF
jgi:hypothetical protein